MKYARFLFAALVVVGLSALVTACRTVVEDDESENIAYQPGWGPTGYDYASYYYLPDIEVYYSVHEKVFIYQEDGAWKRSATLPERYGRFDLDHAHKVVVNEREPFMRHDDNKVKYAGFKDKHDQQPIRESKDPRYFANKEHPEYQHWLEQHPEKKDDNH
ncbi:MAG TPA: hypothetical protein VKS81_08220 [Bacteroidota bacterium]|nr:hypothetical protein [Bacteroidota bacterium]